MAMGTDCAVHKHREWVPLEVHHIWPKGYGGPDTKENKISICANAHSATHLLMEKMFRGPVPPDYLKHFGRDVINLAERGYRDVHAHARALALESEATSAGETRSNSVENETSREGGDDDYAYAADD
jgi:hypothetical protein